MSAQVQTKLVITDDMDDVLTVTRYTGQSGTYYHVTTTTSDGSHVVLEPDDADALYDFLGRS